MMDRRTHDEDNNKMRLLVNQAGRYGCISMSNNSNSGYVLGNTITEGTITDGVPENNFMRCIRISRLISTTMKMARVAAITQSMGGIGGYGYQQALEIMIMKLEHNDDSYTGPYSLANEMESWRWMKTMIHNEILRVETAREGEGYNDAGDHDIVYVNVPTEDSFDNSRRLHLNMTTIENEMINTNDNNYVVRSMFRLRYMYYENLVLAERYAETKIASISNVANTTSTNNMWNIQLYTEQQANQEIEKTKKARDQERQMKQKEVMKKTAEETRLVQTQLIAERQTLEKRLRKLYHRRRGETVDTTRRLIREEITSSASHNADSDADADADADDTLHDVDNHDDSKIQVYWINLDSRKDRKKRMEESYTNNPSLLKQTVNFNSRVSAFSCQDVYKMLTATSTSSTIMKSTLTVSRPEPSPTMEDLDEDLSTDGCWSEGHVAKFLSGYPQGKEDGINYKSRAAAQKVCVRYGDQCGGIVSGGVHHWEVRGGSTPYNGPPHETSYVKLECPAVFAPITSEDNKFCHYRVNELPSSFHGRGAGTTDPIRIVEIATTMSHILAIALAYHDTTENEYAVIIEDNVMLDNIDRVNRFRPAAIQSLATKMNASLTDTNYNWLVHLYCNNAVSKYVESIMISHFFWFMLFVLL